jgi:hypothetical protein
LLSATVELPWEALLEAHEAVLKLDRDNPKE